MLMLSVVCIGVLLQSTTNICSQNKQGWRDWFWSNFTSKVQETAPTAAGAALGSFVVGQTGSDSIASEYMETLKPIGVTDPYIAYATGAILTIGIFTWIGFAIGEVLKLEKELKDRDLREIRSMKGWATILGRIKEIENILRFVIANPLIYPTRSSRINVLLKKDEFLENINDQDDILRDACNQLIREINAVTYSEKQFEEDQKIDSYIMTLRAQIFAQPTLEDQIVALEAMQDQQKTIDQMRGYLSLYYRLKNQLEVEKQLTPEQKTARGNWKAEASKTLQEPVEKVKMDEGKREAYRAMMRMRQQRNQ